MQSTKNTPSPCIPTTSSSSSPMDSTKVKTPEVPPLAFPN